jgi:hypothetical protein
MHQFEDLRSVAPKNNGKTGMSTNFKEPSKSFISVPTADGSPTALGSTGEPMHSLEGALSETLYIYAPAADITYQEGWPPRFLSLGLGLGYVEMVTVARGLKHLKTWESFYLHSFESEAFLRSHMEDFLSGKADTKGVYPQILRAAAAAHDLPSNVLYQKLRELWGSRKWVIGVVTGTTSWRDDKFSCLFFDAFSNKSSPELWTEEFLSSFFTNFAGPRCVLRTYAATGTLKRALIAHGFKVSIFKGFARKRESTQGVRTTPSDS